jgi:hypothetical protein
MFTNYSVEDEILECDLNPIFAHLRHYSAIIIPKQSTQWAYNWPIDSNHQPCIRSIFSYLLEIAFHLSLCGFLSMGYYRGSAL